MEPFILLAIFSSFFVAGGVKGVSGLGLPTVSLALLGLVMPPAIAAALLVVPSLATNVAQSLGKHWAAISRRLWPMWCGILLGALITPLPALSSNTPHVRIGLGAVLVVYGIYGLLKPKATLRVGGWRLLTISAVTGYVTGVLIAATGVFIVPMVMLLQSLSFDKDEMIQALGVSFLVCTLALAGSLGWARSVGVVFTIHGLIACVAAFAGLFVGTRVRSRINLETFRKVLFATFPVLGLAMLLKEFL